TMFTGIYKVPAGHYGVWKNGRFTLKQYWDLTCPPLGHHFAKSEGELVEQLRCLLRDSVRRQMISDVPIGAFLSAGLDSSAIVSMMSGQSMAPVHTYTTTFPERYLVGETALDDPKVASRTARYFGCEHQELCVDPRVSDLLPRLIWHLDEPLADPAIITAFL